MAIYARVSTDNQVGGRFDSCESQTAVCRDYVRQRADDGWYEVASFTDAAYSGGSMNRPGIQSIKRMIEAGEVKVVVIFKLERMSRNMTVRRLHLTSKSRESRKLNYEQHETYPPPLRNRVCRPIRTRFQSRRYSNERDPSVQGLNSSTGQSQIH